MRIASLNAHGVDTALVELWQKFGHQELLPIQEQAVCTGKVLKGGQCRRLFTHVVRQDICWRNGGGPSCTPEPAGCLLVPQKALAEEKFQEFKRKYSGMESAS